MVLNGSHCSGEQRNRTDMGNLLEEQNGLTNIEETPKIEIDKVEYFINGAENVFLVKHSKAPYTNYPDFIWDDDLGKAYGELSYKNQLFGRKIREKEFEALYSFLESDENFKISAITGAAGSGKSGLIYSFCKEIKKKQEWSVYGVTYKALTDSVYDKLLLRAEREKEEKILLVVDYVLVNAEEIGKWIKRLRRKCKDKEKMTIRILLIERAHVDKDRKPYWYIKLIENNKLEDVCDVAGFIKLKQLPDEILENIFVQYVKEHTQGIDVRECGKAAHEVMGRIEENAKTPLFVKCIADAWMEDQSCRKRRWGRKEVLNYMIAKEDATIRQLFSSIEKEESMMKIMVFAMALSGIKLGTDLPKYLKTDFELLREEFGSGRPNLSHLFAEFGKVDEKNMCLKLTYPDILEELFCLEYLKRIRFDAFDPDFVKEFIEQAWATDAKAFTAFLYRIMEDFPEHEMVSFSGILQKPSNIGDETRVLYADVLREYTYWKEEEDEAFEETIDAFRRLIKEVEQVQVKGEIYEKYAVALFNMTEAWSRKGVKEEKRCKYLEIMKAEICKCCSSENINKIFKTACAMIYVRKNGNP